MQNVEMAQDGDKLTITVDLGRDPFKTTDKGNVLIASTQGNVKLATGESVGINIYRSP